MIDRLRQFIRRWTQAAVRSVAFLPLPMTVGGLLLGCGLFYLELHTTLSERMVERLPAVVLTSQDSARNVLGLFIGGLITLMIFSFTQMMSLFNQVANSYSPRLLPYFTSDRSLQFTMGFYLGSITMSVIVMISIRSDESGYVPNVSVLVCLMSGLLSLLLFIYFVTAISDRIQVDAILLRIYARSIDYLQDKQHSDVLAVSDTQPNTDDWYVIANPADGYLGSVALQDLSTLAAKYRTRFYISARKGEFIPRSFPIVMTQAKLDHEQLKKVLLVVRPQAKKYGDWEIPQLDLLVEIAERAMSPGINDPATAVSAIDRIAGLLGHLLFVPEYNLATAKDGGPVWFASVPHKETIRRVFSRLRNYAREDAMVLRRLIKMAGQLALASAENESLLKIYQNEIIAIVADARKNVTNPNDRKLIATAVIEWRPTTKRGVHPGRVLYSDELDKIGTPLRRREDKPRSATITPLPFED